MDTKHLLDVHLQPSSLDHETLSACIDACFACAQACTACSDACLVDGEDADPHCIRTNLDCADVCSTTGRILSRQTAPALDLLRAQLGTCLRASQLCGAAVRPHAEDSAACRASAEACARCEEACDRLLNALQEAAAAV